MGPATWSAFSDITLTSKVVCLITAWWRVVVYVSYLDFTATCRVGARGLLWCLAVLPWLLSRVFLFFFFSSAPFPGPLTLENSLCFYPLHQLYSQVAIFFSFKSEIYKTKWKPKELTTMQSQTPKIPRHHEPHKITWELHLGTEWTSWGCGRQIL